MASLIIRCPVHPVANDVEDWSAQELYFSWTLSNETDFKKVLDLDALPVADSVLAIIPGIDVRLTELKVPACWRRLNTDHLCRLNIDQELLLT